jgi:flagellar biosynthesis chaperone FliJ
VKEKIIDSNSKLEEAKRIVVAKRELYLDADSQFKSMLKLKGKQKELHLEAETKKEEMQLEDIISSRFVFNQSTSNCS